MNEDILTTQVERLTLREQQQAKHSCGFHALEILEREVGALRAAAGRPLRILEIGTFRAYSTTVLAQFGVVYSLDICNQQETQDVVDSLPSVYRDNVVRIVAYNQTAVRELVKVLAPFDVVFVDGDHSESGVRTDAAYVQGIAPVYFFHDYQEKYRGSVQEIDAFVERTGGIFNVWGNTSGLCRVVVR